MTKEKRTSDQPKDPCQPQAKLAHLAKPKKKFLGPLRGIIKIVGDIESAIEPPEAWEGLR
jgi:hypothetical protein